MSHPQSKGAKKHLFTQFYTVSIGEHHGNYETVPTEKLRPRNGTLHMVIMPLQATLARGTYGPNRKFFAVDAPMIPSSSSPLSGPWLVGLKDALLYLITNHALLPCLPRLVSLVPAPSTLALLEKCTGKLVHGLPFSRTGV